MTLEERINKDIKAAMIAKDRTQLEALRAVKSAILLAKTEKNNKGELTPETELRLLQKQVKQRKEAADIYTKQNREELAQKETEEASFIEKYLPEMLSEEELTKILAEIIERTGAASPADMGKVMGVASKELAGKAEGRAIAAKVKELLG